MPPSDHGSPTGSIHSPSPAASTIRISKKRQAVEDPLSQSITSASETTLPYRKLRPSAASLYASTLTPPGSRSASPAPSGRGSPGRNFSGATLGSAFPKSLLDTAAAENPGDPLNLALKAFVPHVAICSSPDADGLIRDKGFDRGLWELLRPFGEHVQGKVTVRDSNGASKSWDDFAIRFTNFGDHLEEPDAGQTGVKSPTSPHKANGHPDLSPAAADRSHPLYRVRQVESVVQKHLKYAEESYLGASTPNATNKQMLDVDNSSAYYSLYLRRLLSGIPLACHETFAHPVACVIAISSRNPNPIQTFRELYQDISQGSRRLPPWVDHDYLRYYVLLHDEEDGDIAKSMALFEQMKRGLGLHCHLLRVRSSRAVESDDDSVQLPRSDWMTADEELGDLDKNHANDEYQDLARYIFDSDATAIRTFVREMVNQSIIPTMERNISVWNDQVASKRKGIGGRLMTFSKRWTAFGSSSKNTTASGSSSSSSYDAQGFYSADTPEAIMRKLADYAFMLRDWKLAMSTYDLLRTDFNDAKAWKYHAAANEMAAFALLIMPPSMSSRTKLESINSMLEQAFYSYLTRCSSSYGALRCLALGLELQRLRGGRAIDEAVKWGIRLMETRLVGLVGDALIKERMAVCCATKQGVGSMSWGSWKRKSAFWSVLATEAWINQAMFIQAQRCLNEARKMYSMLQSDEGISGFAQASDFIAHLQLRLKEGLSVHGADDERGGGGNGDEDDGEATVDEEEVEVMVAGNADKVNRRRSRAVSMLGAMVEADSVPSQALASTEELGKGEE